VFLLLPTLTQIVPDDIKNHSAKVNVIEHTRKPRMRIFVEDGFILYRSKLLVLLPFSYNNLGSSVLRDHKPF
jgi:hypothetical protein